MPDGTFPRWMLLLGATLSLTVGAIWWTITLRQETPRPAALQDNGRAWLIGSDAPPALPDDLPADLRSAITETLRTGQLPIAPASVDLSAAYAKWRSKPKAFRIQEPFGTAVADGNPRFSWTPAEGAEAYRIHLQETAEGSAVTSVDLRAPTTGWLPPAGTLRTGAEYRWQLEALRGGEVMARAPEASFRVLTEEEQMQWKKERQAVGDSHLLRGIVAARAGLREEAATEFRALGRQNPRAERARLFLEQVQTKSAR